MRPLTNLFRCENGASAIEYGLVAVLIAIAAIVGMNALAGRIGIMYNNVESHMLS